MQTHLLEDIGKSIIAAGALGVPAYYLRIPLILAYIAAGILIGPNLGFGFIRDHESIAGISEIGLVLLMFILGLEINLKKLLEMGKSVLVTGVVQIFGTLLISSLFFYLFFFHQFSFPLIYVSVALTLSSTLIVIKILSESMDLDSLPSRMTLGLLILQDFFAVAFLAIQPDLSNIHFFSILSSAARVLSIVAGSMFLAKYILPALFRAVSKHAELLLILAMGWCFTMCGIANALHLSMEMGALIAGISIASFPYHLDVAAKIISVRDFFITLFFVSLGLTIPIPTAYSIELALLMSFAVFLTRFLTVFTSLHRLGFANRASLLASINLSQISEFSLVLASLGIKHKHIGEEILVSFILSLILTALISSFLIPKAHAIYKQINPLLISIGFSDSLSIQEQEEDAAEISSIFMLGFYKDSSSLLVEMQKNLSAEMLKELVVIDFNPEASALLKNSDVKTFFGDVSNPDTLKMLHIDKAEMIICALPDRILKGTTNLRLLSQLKRIAPQAKFIMSSETIEMAHKLYDHGASYVYMPRIIGAEVLFQTLQKLQIEGDEQIKTASLKHLEQRNEIIP